ncbi:PepSY domain-containing protein [Bacillus sp. sid0103]|uniref:PepSY domain-containing protein n=1 Tax=Bacillus sp. sid0103 TaxID=2856337 RepID=UPI001C488265|nr:PepSY domain-containing protein [Bacillus sp. sid0103]MBV7504010.1 PepSY domain-containing protein [Bacillus sp. sid0103]
MKKKTWLWLLISFLFLITVFYINWQKFGISNASADILSKQEAQNLVRERYQGKINQIKLADGQYHIEFEKQDHFYRIKLDAVSGKVLSFTQTGTKSPPLNPPPVPTLSEEEIIKIILSAADGTLTSLEKIVNGDQTIYKAEVKKGNKQTSLTVDASTGKILSSNSTTIKESSKKLTEAEAKKIAQKQVSGSVDHIWLESNGKATYYLVKIKTNDNREAIVQIHAITGNVMSVSWDDHGNDDSEKNDDSKKRSTDDDKNDDNSKNRSKDDKKEDDD